MPGSTDKSKSSLRAVDPKHVNDSKYAHKLQPEIGALLIALAYAAWVEEDVSRLQFIWLYTLCPSLTTVRFSKVVLTLQLYFTRRLSTLYSPSVAARFMTTTQVTRHFAVGGFFFFRQAPRQTTWT